MSSLRSTNASDAPVRTASVIPQGAHVCVWATAGVLSYGLCRRFYACQTCPIDRALSGEQGVVVGDTAAASPEDILHMAPSPLQNLLAVPLRRRRGIHYHTAHEWARTVRPGRVRLGLDDLAGRLTEGAARVHLPRTGQRLAAGQILARVELGDVTVPIPCPVRGEIVARNDELTSHPALAVWSPYDAGWFVEIETDATLSQAIGFLDDEEVVTRWFDAEVERLAGRCTFAVAADAQRLGPTMHDGGTPITSLREALGPVRFRLAVATIFPLAG